MNKVKLLPCPFCGCHDRRVGIRRMGNKGYKVVCGRCGAGGPYVSILSIGGNKMHAQDKAKADWNRTEDYCREYKQDWSAGFMQRFTRVN